MMTKRRGARKQSAKSKASEEAGGRLPLASDVLTLSPMVIAMRLPMVWWELATPQFATRRADAEGHRAVFEKAAAVVESYGATQAQIAQATARFWIGAIAGEKPDAALVSRSVNDIVDASFEPHARRVRANYRRLLAARKPAA